MKIRMEVEGTPITATLDDNETARDFASLLPLALTLSDPLLDHRRLIDA